MLFQKIKIRFQHPCQAAQNHLQLKLQEIQWPLASEGTLRPQPGTNILKTRRGERKRRRKKGRREKKKKGRKEEERGREEEEEIFHVVFFHWNNRKYSLRG